MGDCADLIQCCLLPCQVLVCLDCVNQCQGCECNCGRASTQKENAYKYTPVSQSAPKVQEDMTRDTKLVF